MAHSRSFMAILVLTASVGCDDGGSENGDGAQSLPGGPIDAPMVLPADTPDGGLDLDAIAPTDIDHDQLVSRDAANTGETADGGDSNNPLWARNACPARPVPASTHARRPPGAVCHFLPPVLRSGPYPADIAGLIATSTAIFKGTVVDVRDVNGMRPHRPVSVSWDEDLALSRLSAGFLADFWGATADELAPGQRRYFIVGNQDDRHRVLPILPDRNLRDDLATIRDFNWRADVYRKYAAAEFIVKGRVTRVQKTCPVRTCYGTLTIEVDDSICGQLPSTIELNVGAISAPDILFEVPPPTEPVLFLINRGDTGYFTNLDLQDSRQWPPRFWSASEWGRFEAFYQHGVEASLEGVPCRSSAGLCAASEFDERGQPVDFDAAWTSGVVSTRGEWRFSNGHSWRVLGAGGITRDPPWTFTMSISSDALTDVWGSHPDDIWVVGNRGFIAHGNADTPSWTVTPSGTDRDLVAIHGTASDDVWAVGNGVVLHGDGQSWAAEQGLPTDVSFQDVWTPRRGEVWAVGHRGPYGPVAPPSHTGFDGGAPEWSAGVRGTGVIFHRIDGRWSLSLETPFELNLVTQFLDTAYAAGSFGRVLQFQNGSWRLLPTDITDPVLTLLVHPQSGLWAKSRSSSLHTCRPD